MYCHNCGKEINNDSTYCQFCGTKIFRESNTHTTSVNAPAVGIKIAGTLMLINCGIFSLIILQSLIYYLTWGVKFDIIIISWNIVMVVLGTFLGIKIFKGEESAYGRGIIINAIGIAWYTYQAIYYYFALGYVLSILCSVSLVYIILNKNSFIN